MDWLLGAGSGSLRLLLLLVSAILFLYAGRRIQGASAAPDTSSVDVSPLQFEFATTSTRATALLSIWGTDARERVAAGLTWDFLLIPAYVVLLLVLLGFAADGLRPGSPDLASAARGLALLVLFAGLLDVVENLCLLQLVRADPGTHWAVIAAIAAAGKWLVLLLSASFILFGVAVLLGSIASRLPTIASRVG